MKRLRFALIILCLVVISTAMLACGDEKDTTEYKYAINATEKALLVNEEFQLAVTAEPTKTLEVAYKSSDTAIATVTANGLIKAVAVGNVNITATVEGKTLTCAVAVANYTIDFTKASIDVKTGDLVELEYTITPTTTKLPEYKSSNENVAIIEGNKAKAIGIGSSTISATLNGVTATCVINVSAAYAGASEISIKMGETNQLVIVCEPSSYQPTFTYESANAAIATISSTGLITGASVGNTTVKVFDKEILVKTIKVYVAQSYTYTLNHNTHTMLVGERLDLDVTSNPSKDFADGSIIYSSQDEEIATVDKNGMGVVTAVSSGTVKIVAQVEGEELICELTVEAVKLPVATATKKEANNGDKYNLSSNYAGLKVADWMYFGSSKENDERMKTATPTITAVADIDGVNRIAFWDYKTEMSFTNGTTNSTRMGITSGVATAKVNNAGKYTMKVELKQDTKLIRVFTGAYQATNLTEMTFDNYKNYSIAQESFVAGGAGVGYYIDFNLDLSLLDWSAGHEKYSVTITVKPTAGSENATIVAVQSFVGEAGYVPEVYEGVMPSSGVSFTAAPATYNLSTAIGYTVEDWLYVDTNGADKDVMNTPNQLITAKIPNKDSSFSDYATKLSYTNGKEKESASGLSKGVSSAQYQVGYLYEIDVKLTSATTQIRIFTGAWNATNSTELYYKGVLNKKQSVNTNGYVSFDIDTTEFNWAEGHEEYVVTIIVRASSGSGAHNVSLVAVQVLEGTGIEDVPSADATATVSFVDAPSQYNLSSNQTGLAVKDWVYFGRVEREVDRKANVSPIISYNLDRGSDDWGLGFSDYATTMIYGDGARGSGYTRRGVASSKFENEAENGKVYSIDAVLNANSKQIRIFTGAYNATATATVLYGSKTIATHSFTVAEGSKSGYLVIDLGVAGITWESARTVTIQIKATAGGGNASIVAAQVFDTDASAVASAGATATATNNNIPATAGTDTKMSVYGASDYYVVTGDNTFATKNEGACAINPSFRVGLNNDGGFGGDWGNDTSVSGIMYGATDELESRGFKHNSVSIDIEATITANQTVTLFTTAWQANYGIAVFDEDGNLVNAFDIKTGDTPRPNISRITIDTAGTYRFVVYSTNLAGNLGIAAVGIS